MKNKKIFFYVSFFGAIIIVIEFLFKLLHLIDFHFFLISSIGLFLLGLGSVFNRKRKNRDRINKYKFD